MALSDGAMVLQLREFFDDWHYRILHSSLGRTWPRRKVVQAALDILMLNGVAISEKECESFHEMDEGTMLQFLATKLPVMLRDNFEHLTLQLQIVVTMTTRIRKALEEGQVHMVEEVMEETDGTGIGQQIMKQAVMSASQEISMLHFYQDTWVENMEKRMDRLLRSAELAEQANRQLVAVEAQLESFFATSKGKSQKVLMGLAQSNDKTLITSVFSQWLGITLKTKAEADIRAKFEKQIYDAEEALFEAKRKKVAGVSGSMARSAAQGDEGLLRFVLGGWGLVTRTEKRDGDAIRLVKEMEAKIKESKAGASDKARKFLAKMMGERTKTLLQHCLATWSSFSIDYKRDKIFEDKVKETERAVKEHLQRSSESAKSVLSRLTGATDTGLKHSVVQAWAEHTAESKRAKAMMDIVDGADGRLKGLSDRHRRNANSIQSRVNEQMSINLIMRCFAAWQMDSKVTHIEKYYSTKMESKRRQLQSVQTLFKSFARQLEEGLGNIECDSSARLRRHEKEKGGEAHDEALVGPASAEIQQLIEANGIRAACEKHVGRTFKSWTAVGCSSKAAGSTSEFRVVVDISNGGKEQAMLKIQQGKRTQSGERGPPVVQGLELLGGRNSGMKESLSLPAIQKIQGRVPVEA